jgi:hypothetical protein
VVDPLAEYNMPQYLLREFKVTDARDGSSRTIRQFQVRQIKGFSDENSIIGMKERERLAIY